MKFEQRLKELREEKQIMQKDLAKIINVDKTLISKWENGKKRPIYEDLISLAKYFDVTVGYLLGVED